MPHATFNIVLAVQHPSGILLQSRNKQGQDHLGMILVIIHLILPLTSRCCVNLYINEKVSVQKMVDFTKMTTVTSVC
jgi:hypothetical protein